MTRWIALASVALFALGLPGSTSGEQQRWGKALRIGVLNDQSGAYKAVSGRNGVEAVKMAVEDFQRKYGVNVFGGPIEVFAADHKNDPNLGAAEAVKLLNNSVELIIDVNNSSVALAVAGVADLYHRVYINVGAATTALTNENCNKYTFHYTYDAYMLAHSTAAAATETTGRDWYLMYPNAAFGRDMERLFAADVQRAGGRIRLAEATPLRLDDFTTYLTKARTIRPRVRMLGTVHTGSDLLKLVKQYHELGLHRQGIELAIGLAFERDIDALGVRTLEGALFTTPWYWSMDRQARGWSDRFFARTKIRPTYNMAGDYSAAWQYLEARRRAGADEADKVVPELEGYRFNDFFIRNGEIRKKDHLVIHDVYLAKVKSPSAVTEPGNYVDIVNTIPAGQAFKPLSQAACNTAR